MKEIECAANAIDFLSRNYTREELSALVLGLASALDLPESERKDARQLRAEWISSFIQNHIRKVAK